MTSKLGRFIAAAAAFGFACAVFGADAPARYNLQPPQTSIAHEIYNLHTLIMWIILGIFVVVFSVMGIAIVKHRKSVGHRAEQFHENTVVEIVWTVIPFIILIGMAYPATTTIIGMKDTSNPDITIKATGYQWKWGYEYLQEGVSFYSTLSTPRDQIEDAERRLYELAETGSYGGGFQRFAQALTTAVDMAARAYQRDGKLSGLATGLTDLDALMGGLQPSDLIVLAGRPGMGKTALATNVAYNVAKAWSG